MKVLLFSALLLIIILLINYFVDSKRNNELKILVGFGILIGLLALGLNTLFNDSFGASTPVKVQTENLTDKSLKIYAITFWNNQWSGKGNYVYYDTKLKPNGKSDFWIDNDSDKFWLVAKNEDNGIEYLNVVMGIEDEYDFKITRNEIVKSENAEIAKRLTNKTDHNEKTKKFAIWANIILIGLLILSLINIKTGGNTVSYEKH